MASATESSPFYRMSRPGRSKPRLRMAPAATGTSKSNMCVAPLVTIDGVGNKTVLKDRAVKRTPNVSF